MAATGTPEPPLRTAVEESAPDSDEAFSGANPLQRLPVALRVAGAASAEPVPAPFCVAELFFDAVLFFGAALLCTVLFEAVLLGAELVKTAWPRARVTPSVTPLRRASN